MAEEQFQRTTTVDAEHIGADHVDDEHIGAQKVDDGHLTVSSDDHSDHEAFEDANDSAPHEVVSPNPSTRSLTQRPLSPPKTLPKDVEEPSEKEELISKPADESNGMLEESNEQKDHTVEDKGEPNQGPSPPLKPRGVSKISLDNAALDNVDLEGETDEVKTPKSKYPSFLANLSRPFMNYKINTPKATRPPALPPKSSVSSTLQGLSGSLPSVPWSPPPQAPPQTLTAPQPPPARKLTSPFTWLSRNTTANKETVTSPPLSASGKDYGNRRDTASSVATIGSNPDLMLSKLDEAQEPDGGGRRPGRNSLRDRFKLVRMREEAGISLTEDEKGDSVLVAGRLNIISPTAEKAPDGQPLTSPLPTIPSSPNPALAPGTASGVSAPVADPSIPVDWDLWQSVVYEGPAAVARSSPEELNRAIATGIPSAIRGVVWQVLAQSQNSELETLYRELVARGTDKEKDRMSGTGTHSSAATTNGSVNGNSKEGDSAVVSSASSVHSDQSTPATTVNGMRSPSPPSEKDMENMAKQQAAAISERKKKAKEDAATLQKLEKAIKRDLGARTSYSKFAASAGLQDGLFGVCKAYALYDEGVGYAQGMNFLAMPLLFNMPEEEAFCLLVRLMNQYRLRDLFIQDMPGLHMHLYLFERLLEDFEPALYCHLHRRQVSPHLYATQWFLTLFVYRFPLQLVLRIYDLILSEGLVAILKFGIVLMQKNATTLLGLNDMSALTQFLKDKLFDVYIDQSPSAGSILESGFFGSSGASIDKEVYRADMLVRDACAVRITPELIKTYTLEWEEKTRLEKEREAELEGLKNTNSNLALKVRKLEERVQEHDTDHAALATDLVRTKVENEELKDENESLKTQVSELKNIVAKQPEEVEQRLQEQMAAIQARNQEVHLANSRLEDEMAVMEKDLVKTKMDYAEINSNYEALNRKFADLRRALD